MASPQTHFVITFGFRAIFSCASVIIFSPLQLFLVYYWGTGIDVPDHFKNGKFVEDVYFRIKRFFRGGAVGSPSKGVEAGVPWFHNWQGAILALLSGVVFPWKLCWIPIFFWFTHVIVDRFQKNDGSYPNYSFFGEKIWKKKKGYPIKPRKEIIISTALAVLIIIVEMYFHFSS